MTLDTMPSSKDSIYANPVAGIETFTFDQDVVNVFPDMIQRSVPGYRTIIAAIGQLASRYATADSVCYDLGCSLGAASIAMRHAIDKTCRIVAVDNSAAMIKQCRHIIKNDTTHLNIDLICADIKDIEIENASVVVLNFTLQFIATEYRLSFLQKIYRGLQPGGILILSEKLAFIDPQQQQLQTDMHHLFKKSQGYSDLEISQKRTALENVLIPETLQQHQQRLLKAGFSSSEVWFQYFNFASMLALK